MESRFDQPGFFYILAQSQYPMSITKTLCLGIIISCQFTIAFGQSDSALSVQQALLFGDSLVRANFYQDWETYTFLSCPSAIKYYGGKEEFREHIVEMYYRNEPRIQEKPESLRILSMQNDVDQWQCVIEKIRDTYQEDNRKIKIYTYLVGQSLDN